MEYIKKYLESKLDQIELDINKSRTALQYHRGEVETEQSRLYHQLEIQKELSDFLKTCE